MTNATITITLAQATWEIHVGTTVARRIIHDILDLAIDQPPAAALTPTTRRRLPPDPTVDPTVGTAEIARALGLKSSTSVSRYVAAGMPVESTNPRRFNVAACLRWQEQHRTTRRRRGGIAERLDLDRLVSPQPGH